MKNPTITDAKDDLETSIILALMMGKKKEAALKRERPQQNGMIKYQIGMETFCPPQPEFPKSAYTFDAQASGRIYAQHMSDVVVDPISAIGQRLEVMLLCEGGTLKWSCYKPMPRPKGITAITNARHKWFCVHARTITGGTKEEYCRNPIAISEDGRVLPIKPLGNWKGVNIEGYQKEGEDHLAMTLSVFEDAQRSNAFLATVQEHVRLMFPIGADAYKSFLSMRSGYRNTPTARRNPILHWCAKHIRRAGEKFIPVSEHLRGAEEFTVGPMRLTIEPTFGYHNLARA